MSGNRLVISALLMTSAASLAQEQAEKLGVSSVKMNPRGTGRMLSVSPYGGATYTSSNIRLLLLVQLAFGVDENQVSGADRLGDETYEISVQPESGGRITYQRLKPL